MKGLMSLLKGFGPVLVQTGAVLEKSGKAMVGRQASDLFPASFGTVLEDRPVYKYVNETYQNINGAPSSCFLAPGSKAGSSVALGENSSLWYQSKLSDKSTIGVHSALLDNSSVASDSTIGSYVTIGPGARIGSKVQIKDRVIIGAGLQIGDGCVVESDVILNPGTVLNAGAKVASMELWEGNPAQKVRDLTKEDLETVVESAKHFTGLAEWHAVECTKSVSQIEYEKEAIDQKYDWTHTALEGQDDSWDTFIFTNRGPPQKPNRRGLLFK